MRSSYTPQRHRLNSSYPLSAFDVVLMGRAAYLPLGRRPGPEDRRRVLPFALHASYEARLTMNLAEARARIFRS